MAQRELRGTLGRNEKHEPGSNQPTYKGSCLIDGREYWISAWINENERGKFFSLAFKEKEPKPETRDNRQQASGSPELKQKYAPNGNGRQGAYSPRQQLDDEIPF